jgi:hypothetical protein
MAGRYTRILINNFRGTPRAETQKCLLKDFIWGPVSCKSPWHSSCRAFSADTPQVYNLANISGINNKQPLACLPIKVTHMNKASYHRHGEKGEKIVFKRFQANSPELPVVLSFHFLCLFVYCASLQMRLNQGAELLQ